MMNTMIYDVNFSQMANIFATIAKAEEKVQILTDAAKRYDSASEAYLLIGSNFDEMHDAFEAREKARKAVKNIFAKTVEVLNLDPSNSTDEYMIRESKELWKPMSFLTSAKYRAMEIVKFVN